MHRRRTSDRPAVFYDPDCNTQPLHGGDDGPVKRSITVHVGRSDKEIGTGPVGRPFQLRICPGFVGK